MTAQVRPPAVASGGGGDHPDVDHATLTTVIAGLAAEQIDRAAADTAHAGAADPHPGYLTPAEGAAAFDAIGAATAAFAAAVAASQPLDSDLTAIAALTTTAFGRGLLALADAAAARTALGLGTAATSNTGAFDAAGAAAAAQAASQPLDSDLTAIAALATTAYGRAFLALADAAAGRTALGLGTAATANTGAFDTAGAAAAAQAASQPLDSDLTAIAALATTSYGRSLLAMADAVALKSSLAIAAPNLISTLETADFTQVGGTGAVWTQLGIINPSITIAAGSAVRVVCHGRASESAASSLELVRHNIDNGGAAVSLGRWNMDAYGARLETTEIVTGLAAGAHTFKVEYQKPGGGTLYLRASTQPQIERFGIILEEVRA